MTPSGEVINEREARHGRRLSDRLMPIMAVLGVVLLVIVGVLSVVTFSTARRADRAASKAQRAARAVKKTTVRLDSAVRGGCDRLQRLRDDVNVQADGQYDVIKLAADRVPEPFAALYKRIARETSYSPPTDCDEATVHPLRYKPPPLIPWSKINACFDRGHLRVTTCHKR